MGTFQKLDPLETFWRLARNLKLEHRQGWLAKVQVNQVESVADHSFALAILALIEAERRNLDVETTLKLALLHDLDEAITGDFTPEAKKHAGMRKITREREKAIRRILQTLPSSLRTNYRKLWNELIFNNTKEAKLVHQLDKLEMALQASEYARTNNAEAFTDFYSSADSMIVDKRLRKIFERIPKRRRC